MRVLLALGSLAHRRTVLATLQQFIPAKAITSVSTGSECLARLRSDPRFDIALLEDRMPDFCAEHVIRLAQLHGECPPMLVLCSDPDEDAAATCLCAGARDVLGWEEIQRPGVLQARVRLAIAEARREQRACFEQRAQFILSLAGGVAEDLNNGLVTVLGKAALLARELEPASKQAADCEAVIEEAERLAEAAQQLAAYTLSGGNERGSAAMDVNRCVESAVAQLDPSLRRGVNVQLELGPRLWPCRADGVQFTHAILALLTNACEAMPTGGMLSVFTENSMGAAGWRSGTEDAGAGEYVHVCVSDNGCGVPPQLRPRIFDPYVTTHGDGRGLGLSAVATTVTRCGGFITLESESGCGTDVHLYLPRLSEPEQAIEAIASLDKERQTVLVVEDDAGVREVEVEILEQHGYRVITASDGRTAIDTYKRHADVIDLVLLDMKLPGMSGDEVYRALANVNPEVRVIVCTGAAEDSAAAAVLKHCSVSGFLTKPFTPKRLIQQAQAVLQA